MFTGIIRQQGIVVSLTRSRRPQLVVAVRGIRTSRAFRRGDSVAVDGICLTVVRCARQHVTFDLLPETLRATTLGVRRAGDRVNLEPSLRMGDQISGHWVMGHVDGIGRVVRRRRGSSWIALVIEVPVAFRPYVAPKGSVAVDGVSLTVGPRVAQSAFTIFLIPHTTAATTLGARRPGDVVNLEADPMARYAVATAPWLAAAAGGRRTVARWLIDGVR